MTLRVMSADCHTDLFYLLPDVFTSRTDAPWDEAIPRFLERDGRQRWVSDDEVPTRGSHYPHRDGTWPCSRKVIEEQFGDVDEATDRKMLCENVRRGCRIE